jgi:hypothetical protein
VFDQKCLHYQCGMESGIVVQQEPSAVVQQEPSALCSKLWPHSGNALQ